MSDYRLLANNERAALQKRTARSVRALWAFQGLPVQVGSPCPQCGGLFWWVTGKEPIAPTGHCLNCQPGAIEGRPALRKIVAESMLDDRAEASVVLAPDDDDYQLQMF